MSKYFIEDTTLNAIGKAIRTKEGSTEPIPTVDMAERIANLPSGANYIYTDKVKLDPACYVGPTGNLYRADSPTYTTYMIAVPYWGTQQMRFAVRVVTNNDHNRCRYGILQENPLLRPTSGAWTIYCLTGTAYNDGQGNQHQIISATASGVSTPITSDTLYVVLTVSNQSANASEPEFSVILV